VDKPPKHGTNGGYPTEFAGMTEPEMWIKRGKSAELSPALCTSKELACEELPDLDRIAVRGVMASTVTGGYDIEGSTWSVGWFGRMRSVFWWVGLTLGVTGLVPCK
jgi:hypothetical protein